MPDSRISSGPFGALALCAVAAMSALEPGGARGPKELLRDIAPISDAEWAAIDRGEAFAKTLDTDSREIAVVGAVRIAASSDQLVERYRDIERLKRSAIVIDVGRLSRPPQASDLARTPFEEYSLNLRECRPYDCRVRLSEQDIARFHREVDWRAPDWRTQSAALWRTVLADHVDAYVRRGRIALPVYANKHEPLSVASELSGLVGQFGFLATYSPSLTAYLRELAPPGPADAEHTLYWSKEDFGVRPVLRISHQVITRTSEPPAVVVLTNQIYADHYLDAAMTVTIAVDAPGTDRRAFYLFSVSRARTRSLGGVIRSFVRSTVQRRSREGLHKILSSMRTGIESGAK